MEAPSSFLAYSWSRRSLTDQSEKITNCLYAGVEQVISTARWLVGRA